MFKLHVKDADGDQHEVEARNAADAALHIHNLLQHSESGVINVQIEELQCDG